MDSVMVSAVMGGAVGSLITIITAKLTGIVLKEREHKRGLQRAFFERKLSAAEHAMAQWHATASLLTGIITLYEQITGKERELEYELFRVTNDAFVSQWQKISQTAHEAANTLLVYFDTEESAFINADGIKKLLDRLSSIRSLDISLKFALDMFDKCKGTRKEGEAWEQVKRIMDQYHSNLKDISAIFGQAQKEMVDFLSTVRKDMRRYE